MSNLDYLNQTKSISGMYMRSMVDIAWDCAACDFKFDKESVICKGCDDNLLKYLPNLSDEELKLWLKPGQVSARKRTGENIRGLLILTVLVCIVAKCVTGV